MMPKKSAVLNYSSCKPEYCKNGVCTAAAVCRHKVLKQEKPFEQPDPPMICIGCGICVQACERGAINLI
jgi:NAD-dependent dihydropyrimidine dehydrogenase PreA subunit